jgi:hypothetical protein
MFRRIDSTHLIRTSERLRRRIEERFPDSGLGRIAGELEAVTNEAAAMAAAISKPNWWLRGLVTLAILALLGVLGAVATELKTGQGSPGWSDFMQGLEALVNSLIFAGAAIYFLVSLETRRKRQKVLSALHTLRSLAHIVDMHQLTKDPESVAARGRATASSPERSLTPFELNRYLDYASELLAIIGKLAAVYVQDFHDPIALNAASDVQDLTVNLSRSIWQKIVISAKALPGESQTGANSR